MVELCPTCHGTCKNRGVLCFDCNGKGWVSHADAVALRCGVLRVRGSLKRYEYDRAYHKRKRSLAQELARAGL